MAKATPELGEAISAGRQSPEADVRERGDGAVRERSNGAGHERPDGAPRERILDACYELFSHRGIRDVGIDEVVARSGVAKATLYRHFPSKNDLIIAFLDLREQRWTRNFVEAEVLRRAEEPEQRLLAIFDIYDEWFHREDFEACSFVNVLLELGRHHPAGAASIRHLEQIRSMVRGFAEDAGLHGADAFVQSWYILMKGSIVAAAEGDAHAAVRGKAMARTLIEQHR
jgi:AcrR family transcriptional regulator